MSVDNKALSAASQTILLELARFLLHNNMTHKEFTQLSRWAFVQAGTEILEKEGGFSTQRLIELTGLSRKDISRAEPASPRAISESEKTWINAMRVLHKWHTKTEFVDKHGKPRDLDLSNPDVFRLLFDTSMDEEGAALLAELVDAGCVEEASPGEWQPKTRYYIPKDKGLMFHYFGQAISRLVSTMNRNINNPKAEAWVERVVSTVDLKPDARPLFSRVGKEQALRLVESLDDWTSSNEHQSISDDSSVSSEVGFGVYFFDDKTIG